MCRWSLGPDPPNQLTLVRHPGSPGSNNNLNRLELKSGHHRLTV